jgi:Fe-S-cluster-containing hydrogenase component 2
MMNTEKSAIRIQKDDLDTSLNLPVLCHQCKEMKCLNGEEVIEGLEKKKFIWDRIRAERCPFDALTVFGENAYHCDLCAGNPQCVKICTPKAIRI